jgi:hypothetical protein
MEQTQKDINRFKIHYLGSFFWLIFWLIVFFPIAFVLLLTAISVEVGQGTYTVLYNGSRFWLGFWVLVFFPVAFVLLFLNGLSITVTKPNINDFRDNDIDGIQRPL